MSDQTNAVAPQGARPAPEAPASGGDANKPQFITLEEAERIAKQHADAALKEALRYSDGGRIGLEKRVKEDLKNLEKTITLQRSSGMEITKEQENAWKTQVINQAFTEEPPTQPSATAPQPGQAGEWLDEEPPDPVSAQAWQIMEQVGLSIDENDPEVQLLDRSDEQAFIASIKPALAAKAKRLLGQLETPGAPPPHPPTNLGGSGAQSPETYVPGSGFQMLQKHYRDKG